MKKITFLFAALGCAVLFAGCNNEPEVTPTPTPVESQLKCKIGGVQFTSTAPSAIIQAGRLVIIATETGTTKNILLQADESVAQVKTYNLLGGGVDVGVYNPGGGEPAFVSAAAGTAGSNNGNFKVTSVDATAKTMSGTFVFTAVGGPNGITTVEVTEGTFTNIPYVLNPTTGNSNQFSLSVNGTAVTITEKSGSLLGGQLALSGTATQTNSYKTVNMFLSPTVAPGVINASDGFGTFGYQEGPSPTSAVIYSPVTGNTITITEHNISTKRIKGSFNCLNMTTSTAGGGTRSLVGNFDITYQ